MYLWIKAFHLISMIAWMAGLLYLPRLFVYHANVAVGSEHDRLFQVMEKRLLRYIMNPSMIATLFFGVWLIMLVGGANLGGWFHIKSLLLVLLFAFHGLLASYRKRFVNGSNTHTDRYYRVLNEVPTVIMVAIVILAVVKPF